MTEKENKALYIAEQCRKAGMTLAGAAGVLANVEPESAFKSDNLQDSYERALGYTDESYTAAVDNGTYPNFTGDAAGYGLAQWTLGSRKAKMLAYFRNRKVSIGDFRTQVDFLIDEMRQGEYQPTFNLCCTSNEPYQCGYQICMKYERPADTEAQSQYRGGLAQKWYNFLVAHAGEESSIPDAPQQPQGQEPAKDDDGIAIPQTWPPRTLHKGRCSGWKEIYLLQALLELKGYNVLINGMFEDALEKKTLAFQKTAFPNQPSEWDGIVGPRTWRALGINM